MATGAFLLVSAPTLDIDMPQKSRSGRVKRIYRCRHCSRTFKRSEHQARHERVHTNERPFACAYCDRKYARKDLVKRHERSLHAEAYREAHPEEFGNVSSPKVPATASDVGTPRSRRDTGIMQPPGSNGRRPSILTPPTEEFSLDFNGQDDMHVAKALADMSASDGLAVHQQFHSTFPEMQYSPPISLLGLESSTLQEFGTDHPMESRRHSYDNHYDYNNAVGNLGWQDLDGNGASFEPPSKRRLIEVDPLLLLHDAGHPLPDQNAEVVENDFPSVAFNEHYTASSEANVPPPSFGDLSLDFLDFFEFGIFNASDRFTADQPLRTGQERFYAPPVFHFDEHVHQTVCQDARQRLPTGDSMAALFPSVNDLNRFFSGYIECFHRHFPIIHLPSLEMLETPSPLIFAMCSIGAQYRLDRQKAKNLFALAGTMSSYALRAGLPISAGTPGPAALWIMQTRVLLSLGGIFSGKTSVVLRTIENLGLFAIEYRVRKSLLSQRRDSQHSSWEEWVSRESSKRLLCGMFIVSNLISTTFGIQPGFETKDLEFEVLDEETLWNARTAGEWHELKDASMMQHQGGSTVRAAMTRIINNGQQQIHDGLTMLLVRISSLQDSR
jgi:DNA-directed RNA polymerase subunit RPC12/RpoP